MVHWGIIRFEQQIVQKSRHKVIKITHASFFQDISVHCQALTPGTISPNWLATRKKYQEWCSVVFNATHTASAPPSHLYNLRKHVRWPHCHWWDSLSTNKKYDIKILCRMEDVFLLILLSPIQITRQLRFMWLMETPIFVHQVSTNKYKCSVVSI